MEIFEHKELNPDYLTPGIPDIPKQKGFDNTAPDNPSGLPSIAL